MVLESLTRFKAPTMLRSHMAPKSPPSFFTHLCAPPPESLWGSNYIKPLCKCNWLVYQRLQQQLSGMSAMAISLSIIKSYIAGTRGKGVECKMIHWQRARRNHHNIRITPLKKKHRACQAGTALSSQIKTYASMNHTKRKREQACLRRSRESRFIGTPLHLFWNKNQ